MSQTIIHQWNDLPWVKNPNHPELYQKTFLTPQEADRLNISVSSVLYEQLKYHGAVTPHYHTVAELIFLVKGSVHLYANGEWCVKHAGDSFFVPAKMVHCVVNTDPDIDSEQISVFIPEKQGKMQENVFFETYMVDSPRIEEVF